MYNFFIGRVNDKNIKIIAENDAKAIKILLKHFELEFKKTNMILN